MAFVSSDPRLLRSFVAVADELHFGRAARRLHLAQPALSKQIRRLELQLGVALFARTRARVELTAAGAELLGPAREAVAALDAVEAAGRRLAGGEQARLALGLSPGVHYLAQVVLDRCARLRPPVRVRARQDSSGALARAVAAGELEVALAICSDTGEAAGVRCERLLEEPVVVAVAAGHPLAGRGRVALAELAGETFALVDAADGPGYNRAVTERCEAAGFTPRTVADPHGPMAWETAVRTGGCAGLTTRASAVSTAQGVRLLELGPPVGFPVELLTAARGVPSPAAAAFCALARELARAGALRSAAAPPVLT